MKITVEVTQDCIDYTRNFASVWRPRHNPITTALDCICDRRWEIDGQCMLRNLDCQECPAVFIQADYMHRAHAIVERAHTSPQFSRPFSFELEIPDCPSCGEIELFEEAKA